MIFTNSASVQFYHANKEVDRSWCPISSEGKPPSARHSHTAVVHGNSLYVFAGIGIGGTLLNDLFEYNFGLFLLAIE
jgi:hypothetical protein